jgi:hypothetical protein
MVSSSTRKGLVMFYPEIVAKTLIEDRHRELRYRAKPRSGPQPRRRWSRPGRR